MFKQPVSRGTRCFTLEPTSFLLFYKYDNFSGFYPTERSGLFLLCWSIYLSAWILQIQNLKYDISTCLLYSNLRMSLAFAWCCEFEYDKNVSLERVRFSKRVCPCNVIYIYMYTHTGAKRNRTEQDRRVIPTMPRAKHEMKSSDEWLLGWKL